MAVTKITDDEEVFAETNRLDRQTFHKNGLSRLQKRLAIGSLAALGVLVLIWATSDSDEEQNTGTVSATTTLPARLPSSATEDPTGLAGISPTGGSTVDLTSNPIAQIPIGEESVPQIVQSFCPSLSPELIDIHLTDTSDSGWRALNGGFPPEDAVPGMSLRFYDCTPPQEN